MKGLNICPIHGSEHGREVENRFFNGLVEIRWRGFRFLWKNGREAWPPSIDAFTFIETLEKEDIFRESGKTLLDAGSGTGFLGVIAAHLSENITRITLWDWLLTPALYGQINWFRNFKNKELNTDRDYVGSSPAIGLYYHSIFPRPLPVPFDLVLCNPPYLPIPEKFKKLSFESTTSGTVLLEHMISNSRQLGKEVYIQFSNLASVEANACASNKHSRLLPVGPEHEIPCRITDAINNPDYLKYLRKRVPEFVLKKGRYMHKIRAYKIA